MAVLFDGYKYQNHVLHSDGVSLEEIAQKVGTPCYVYSHKLITDTYQELEKSLKDSPHLICYAVKANSRQPFSV